MINKQDLPTEINDFIIREREKRQAIKKMDKSKHLIKAPYLVVVLEASTAHVTEGDMQLLTHWVSACPDPEFIVYEYSEGFFIHISCDREILDDENKAAKERGISQELINLRVEAFKCGAKYLQLDGDGSVYEELPQFDW